MLNANVLLHKLIFLYCCAWILRAKYYIPHWKQIRMCCPLNFAAPDHGLLDSLVNLGLESHKSVSVEWPYIVCPRECTHTCEYLRVHVYDRKQMIVRKKHYYAFLVFRSSALMLSLRSLHKRPYCMSMWKTHISDAIVKYKVQVRLRNESLCARSKYTTSVTFFALNTKNASCVTSTDRQLWW